MLDRKQEFKTVPIESVSPHPDNPRRGDVLTIAKSIKSNGFFGSILVQKSTGFILAGNHRFLAAQNLGIKEIPAIFIDVTDDEALRIMLADNRTSDLGDYDDEKLLEILLQANTEDEFIGYDRDFIDALEATVEKKNTLKTEFNEIDAASIITEHKCPSCGYEF